MSKNFPPPFLRHPRSSHGDAMGTPWGSFGDRFPMPYHSKSRLYDQRSPNGDKNANSPFADASVRLTSRPLVLPALQDPGGPTFPPQLIRPHPGFLSAPPLPSPDCSKTCRQTPAGAQPGPVHRTPLILALSLLLAKRPNQDKLATPLPGRPSPGEGVFLPQ